MNIKCKFGFHEWGGCECYRCGKTREEGHDWSIRFGKCERCGKTWSDVIGNEREARQILASEESKADLCSGWAEIIRAWKKDIGDDLEARRCMAAAEGEAKTKNYIWDWIRCAEIWKDVFEDEREAQRCLTVAQSHVGGYDERNNWHRCAKAFFEILSAKKEALFCQKNASVEKVKQHGFHGEDKRRWAYEGASALDWVSYAESWVTLFNDKHESQRCLTAAEAKANGSSDWALCAKSWMTLLNNKHEAQRCLGVAESKADSSGNTSERLRQCAGIWKIDLGDEQEARR